MTELEQEILTALIELEQKVKSMRNVGAKPDLQPLFARLDDLARQLPKGSDPNLLHFLHRKSYEKARLLLTGS